MKNTYTPVIGLEVHVELKTKSKMFCSCANDWFGAKPNSHTCPVCLGLPGALPVPNSQALEWCIMIGQALNCHIPLASKFDRKNYFYPDLAKGYQISQYDQPFAENGYMLLSSGKKIGIRRAHMEEDTGKLMHETVDGKHVSLIDFNRSGVPLVEIVTEPDFTSASEVKEYLQKLQQLVRYLDVATADMDKGEMRLEPNISLRAIRHPGVDEIHDRISHGKDSIASFQNDNLPDYKVEVKNINSFSFVEKAIAYEIERQAKLLDDNIRPAQETRGWDEDQKKTISQRSKEEAADYRYFPEPDIPAFFWTDSFIKELKSKLPELPDAKKERFIKDYKLSDYNAEILTRERNLADYFEEAAKVGKEHAVEPTKLANTMINKKINTEKVLPAELVKDIKSTEVVDAMTDEDLQKIITKVIANNEKVVTDYKSGKENAIMFLVGQVMKEGKGKVKAETVKDKMQKALLS